MQTKRSTDGTSLVKLQTIAGSIAANDVLEGATTGATGTAGDPTDRFLLNVSLGAFASGDWFFSKASNTEAYIDEYVNKSGSLTGNTGGRITIDVETIDAQWVPGDVIYGSVTSYILSVKGISGTQIQLNQYIHGIAVHELDLGVAIVDIGTNDTFRVGDEVSLLQGTAEKNPGFKATVTRYLYGIDLDPSDPNYGLHKLWIGNLIPIGTGEDISAVTQGTNNIGKIDLGSNFPSIYANVTNCLLYTSPSPRD